MTHLANPPDARDRRSLRFPLQIGFALLPLLYLWFRLIENLRVEWGTNPQYSYGYIVPLLCIGLVLQRWHNLSFSLADGQPPRRDFLPALILTFAILAFLYLPTRLVELAVPEWRPIQWALGIIATGLSLVLLYFAGGAKLVRQLAFPICFILVAIPWPTLIEQPVIQTLTRINASLVIEVMGIVGVPAMQHGNVIEVGTGVVGVDEACSGIRSFQSSLMISLFLGAFYQLRIWRRMFFVPFGFLLAMFFNLVRTSFLTYAAAKEGMSAVNRYHDPAGLWILVACTASLWIVGMLLRSKPEKPELQSSNPEVVVGHPEVSGPSPSTFQRVSLSLLAWLLFVEIGSTAWYRIREARLPESPVWTLELPTNNGSYKPLPMADATYNLLRFDEGKQGAWTETNLTTWAGFYYDWNPGRVAGYLAKRHTPEICLPASGRKMLAGPELIILNIHDIQFPFRRYRFGPDGDSLQVFHCRWEAGIAAASAVQHESARFNLIRAIWNGRGNQGQKVLEFIISGTEDPEEATRMLQERLSEMIQVKK